MSGEPWLVLRVESDQREVDVTTGTFVIGRGRSANLRTPAEQRLVSSRHVQLTKSDDNAAASCLNLSASNAVYINGTKLGSKEKTGIKAGDRVALCKPDPNSPFSFRVLRLFDQVAAAADPSAAGPSEPEQATVAVDDAPHAPATDATDSQNAFFRQELSCGICQEIVHNPITCIPCLHSFCSGCSYAWLVDKKQNTCPVCRTALTRAQRNHQLGNLADMFLQSNPGDQRAPDELAELAALDKKIPASGVLFDESSKRSGKKRRRDYDDDDSEEDSDSDSYADFYRARDGFYDDDDDGDGDNGTDYARAQLIMGHPTACFLCQPGGAGCGCTHVTCSQCGGQFADVGSNPLPPQFAQFAASTQCELCGLHYCDTSRRSHAAAVSGGSSARGCRAGLMSGKPAHGALTALRDHDVERLLAEGRAVRPGASASTMLPPGSLNGNAYEAAELDKHLRREGQSWADVFRQSLEDLASGSVKPVAFASLQPGAFVSGEKVCCGSCALAAFGQLLFSYALLHVDRSKLPAAVKNRPNCWYGNECRTQTHNATHAANYNHICLPRPKK